MSFMRIHLPARHVQLRAALVFTVLLGAALTNAVAQDSPTGSAVAPNTAQDGSGIPTHPVQIFEQMGYWVAPFLAASIIAVWFAMERLVVLRHSRVIPGNFVQTFLDSVKAGRLDSSSALKLCEKNDSAVASVFAHGIRKWGRPSVEVEQAIIDGGERQVGQLRRHLRVLNGVATVTPLFGLLGTVVGMIQAFNDIALAGAMGKADQLAAGIAMALLTTACGLAIAIPALIMYMYLCGRVEALVMEMDELSQNVVQLVSAEAQQARAAAASPKRPRPVADASATPRETPEPVST